MSDQLQAEIVNDKASQVASEKAVVVGEAQAAGEQKKSTLKGMLMMIICCAAPLLLLAAIPALGLTVGWLAGVASGLLSVVALLACPVGMFLMMRTMSKEKK